MPMSTKEAQREYQREWMRKRRAEYFQGKCCVVCGTREHLELDHIDPKKKIDHKIWSWAESRRMRELRKCQILCTNCHQDKTFQDFGWQRHGTRSAYRDQKCRCVECRAWNTQRLRLYWQRRRLRKAD